MPGYTGFVSGLKETLGSTPVIAQHKAAAPALGEFLHTRRFIAPVATPIRDPCNFPETFKDSGEQVNLWPSLQTTGRLSFKIGRRCIFCSIYNLGVSIRGLSALCFDFTDPSS